MPNLRFLGFFAAFSVSACDVGSSAAPPSTHPGSKTPGTTGSCSVDSAPPSAPGGYYTNGATVCSADGTPHLFHGVARPSLEWGSTGDHISADDFHAIASWHANVVRIALNQDFWLAGAALYDATYSTRIAQAVSDAEAAGLDVILDLHWSDRGDLSVTKLKGQNQAGTSNQQQMADSNSKEFWSEVASQFKDDGHVLFELYNEPNKITWDVWLNGGTVAEYNAIGMQELYDTVRATGANNLVLAGGLDWSFDLSAVGAKPIQGYNIIYATHPYDKSDNAPALWENAFGYLASGNIAPVIATEFGDGTTNCTGAWDSSLIQYADARGISWTAWAWYPSGCSFPALISDWAYTTTVQGDAVKAALLAYPYEPAGRPDGGSQGGASSGSGGGSSSGGSAGANSEGGADAAAGASTESGGTSADGGAGGSAGSIP